MEGVASAVKGECSAYVEERGRFGATSDVDLTYLLLCVLTHALCIALCLLKKEGGLRQDFFACFAHRYQLSSCGDATVSKMLKCQDVKCQSLEVSPCK